MSRTYTGGCACGAIRYEISGEPIVMVDCQCRQCRRATGGGHGSYLTFSGAEVKLTGEASRFEATGDGGTVKSSGFCPACGSPVFMTFPANPDIFVVRPASLDDPAGYRPQFVTWTAAAQAWDRVDPALPSFDRMPPASS
jgi:hypothetical protein